MNKFYLGIDIGGTKTAIVLSDLDLKIIEKREFKTIPGNGFENFIINIEKNLTKFKFSEIISVGISVGGPLDVCKGILYNPPHLQWGEVNLINEIKKIISAPILIEHDANAGAYAEYKLGAGKGLHNIIFLTLGTGLGAGIIINDKLYRGKMGTAGEIGHIRLDKKGPFLYGKEGSWESFCSGAGIAKYAEYLYPDLFKNTTTKDISNYARKGEEKAIDVLVKSGTYMGKGLSILFDTLDPDAIILGNIGWKLPDCWLNYAKKVILEETLNGTEAIKRIKKSMLKEKIGDYASLLVAKRALEGEKCEIQ